MSMCALDEKKYVLSQTIYRQNFLKLLAFFKKKLVIKRLTILLTWLRKWF